MQNPADSAPRPIKAIARILGLSDKQAAVLMPQGPDVPAQIIGTLATPEDDGQSWAEREYEKDNRGWQSMGRIDKP